MVDIFLRFGRIKAKDRENILYQQGTGIVEMASLYFLLWEDFFMYLSLAQKREIFKSFPEVTESVDKYGRYGYNFLGSKERRKKVAGELSYTGNGYVYGQNLVDYRNLADERGWVNVSDFSETQLKDIVRKAIDSLK